MTRALDRRPTGPRQPALFWQAICRVLGHRRRNTGWLVADCYCARCDRALIKIGRNA